MPDLSPDVCQLARPSQPSELNLPRLPQRDDELPAVAPAPAASTSTPAASNAGQLSRAIAAAAAARRVASSEEIVPKDERAQDPVRMLEKAEHPAVGSRLAVDRVVSWQKVIPSSRSGSGAAVASAAADLDAGQLPRAEVAAEARKEVADPDNAPPEPLSDALRTGMVKDPHCIPEEVQPIAVGSRCAAEREKMSSESNLPSPESLSAEPSDSGKPELA